MNVSHRYASLISQVPPLWHGLGVQGPERQKAILLHDTYAKSRHWVNTLQLTISRRKCTDSSATGNAEAVRALRPMAWAWQILVSPLSSHVVLDDLINLSIPQYHLL